MKLDRQSLLNISGSLVGIMLVGMLGFLAWALVFVRMPEENETVMNVLLGILSTQISLIVGFYFGSNVSSKQQTETIDKLADTTKTAQAAALPTQTTVTLTPGETATVAAAEDSP